MTCKTAFVYHEMYLRYDFGEWHPYKPYLWKLALEKLKNMGVFNDTNISLIEAFMADENLISLVHTNDYINFVKHMSNLGYGYLDYGDTPATKGIYEGAAHRVGGSVTAAKLIADGLYLHAFNFGGGLHHAKPSNAAGFCVFNDIAIAVRYLQKSYNYKRIAIVDIDGHHGDGTQEIFYNEATTLKISLHKYGYGFYPGTGWYNELGADEGYGYTINIPLIGYTNDDTYLYAINEIVLPLLIYYKPEIIVMQFGADGHVNDPLVGLSLTTRTYSEVARIIHKLSHEISNGKLLVLGGGGYNPDDTARCWSLGFIEISDIKIDEKIKETLYDKINVEGGISKFIYEIVNELKKKLRAIHGIF
ncbi:MAG: acetoin utilization protein AcuC [Thermoprotei archaeon]